MSASPAWVALSLVEHLGAVKMRLLLEHFGDLDAVLTADARALRKVPGIGPKISESIVNMDARQIAEALPRWQAAGVRVLTASDPLYPRRLSDLEDAPPTLFARGTLCAPDQRAVGVVGTRTPSPDAIDAAQRISYGLAARGIAVVSGLALGVDAAAHLGALAARDGCTLAVLGSGVLNIYPPANRALAQAILQRGALVSETSPDAGPKPSSLVARNRLISGLSEALIVIETREDGGAMHAARFAQKQGRRVYALDCGASGNQALLADGALPISPDLDGFA